MFKPDSVKNAHFGQNYLHTLDGCKIITPLRRLDNIIHSWTRRDMDLKHLHAAIGQMIDFGVDFYFPVDADDREDYVARLNEKFDLDLQTDWRPQGGQQKSGDFEPKYPEYADMIREDYTDWFEQFYGQG